jgi:hypothetical protein
MKSLIISALLILTVALANAQTIATDFTATDCKGNSHTLFTELDNGKTIVLVWVMPCSACKSGASAALNAVQSYTTSQPGKVLLYLIDDLGDNNCASLASWATTNSIDTSKMTIFQNSGNVISESNYGGSGMPHIVVVSGTDHKIYFNEKNGMGTGVQNALNIATGVTAVPREIKFSVSPNPVSGSLTITYAKAIETVTVLSLNGQVVKMQSFEKGKINPSIDLAGIAAGTYMVRITGMDGNSGITKIVKE